MPVLSVVIPIYNSAAFLEERLRFLSESLQSARIDHEIVAVDDGSADASAEILRRAKVPNLRAVFLEKNCGKFGALRAGVERAEGDCILFTDADIPYDLAVIPLILRLIAERKFHLVAGDRTLAGSSYRAEMPPIRRVATTLFTGFVRLLVTGGLADTQAGLKACRRDVAKAIFPLLRENGFSGDVELLYVALKYNLEIRRVPVRLRYQGNSTVRPLRDGAHMLRALFRIRGRHRRGLYESAALRAIASQEY